MYDNIVVDEITEEVKLKETLATFFGITVEDIDDDSTSETIANWDSILHIALLAELERIFNVTFSDTEGFDLLSVKAIKLSLREKGVKI